MPKARDKKQGSLLLAVSTGDVDETECLLLCGHDPNAISNSRGETPIFLAARLGYRDIFHLLLQWKASVKGTTDIAGNSILHVVNDLELLKTAVSYDLDINCKNQLGRTPLHCAILRRNIDVVNVLIEHGSDVNLKDIDGNTSLHFASKCYLYHNKYCLRNRNGRINILDLYERNSIVPYIKSQMVGGFHFAVLEHDQDLFDYICYVNSIMRNIKLKVDSDPVLSYLQTFSIEKDEHLELLSGNNELLQIGKSLLKSGADPTLQNFLGEVPLHFAVDGSNIDLINLLCQEAPSAVNIQDNMGKTPLVRLFSLEDNYGDEDEEREKKENERKYSILKILCDHGADLNLLDINGFGVLFRASHYFDYLKTIVHLNPDLNVRSCTGASILHLMPCETYLSFDSALELLLGNGLDVNARDDYGATPLFFASWSQDYEWINLLLKHGCCPGALDCSNFTAADLAVFNKSISAEILKTALSANMKEHEGDSGTEPEDRALEGDNSEHHNAEELGLPKESFQQQFLYVQKNTDIETEFKSFSLPVDSNLYIADLLESPVTGRSGIVDENLNIKQAVLHLITNVAKQFERFDPRFKMRMELSGSVSEGTKCGRADEFDFLCCLEEFEKAFQPEEGKSDPPGFARVIATGDQSAAFHEFCSKDGYLINSRLVEMFYRFLYRAIHVPEVWESTKALYPSLYYHPELELKGPSVDLTLRWFGRKFKDLFISIDMVPALYFSQWWPFAANDHLEGLGNLHTEGCHVVLTTYQDVQYYEEGFDLQVPRYFRISFSNPERRILKSVAQHVRDGYMLAKSIRNECQPIHKVFPLIIKEFDKAADEESEMSCCDGDDEDLKEVKPTTSFYSDQAVSQTASDSETECSQPNEDEEMSDSSSVSTGSVITEEHLVRASIISTYMLKMALFHEIDRQNCSEDLDPEQKTSAKDTPVDSHKACEWAKRIYNRLKVFIETGSIPSFFIPGFDLMARYDTSDFYVFDNLILEEELEQQQAKEQKMINYSPLPEENQLPVDTLPNTIDELVVNLRLLKDLSNSRDKARDMNKKSNIRAKLRKLCRREEQLIFIAMSLRIFRQCDAGGDTS